MMFNVNDCGDHGVSRWKEEMLAVDVRLSANSRCNSHNRGDPYSIARHVVMRRQHTFAWLNAIRYELRCIDGNVQLM